MNTQESTQPIGYWRILGRWYGISLVVETGDPSVFETYEPEPSEDDPLFNLKKAYHNIDRIFLHLDFDLNTLQRQEYEHPLPKDLRQQETVIGVLEAFTIAKTTHHWWELAEYKNITVPDNINTDREEVELSVRKYLENYE